MVPPVPCPSCRQRGLEASSAALGLGAAIKGLGSGLGGWGISPTTFTVCPSRWKLWLELSKGTLRTMRSVLSAGWGCCSWGLWFQAAVGMPAAAQGQGGGIRGGTQWA